MKIDPRCLSLRSGDIHLWLTFYEEIDERLLVQYRNLMNDSEKSQESRFYFENDRRRYSATRALVRTTLSRYCSAIAPEDWVFTANLYGRPQITNASAGDSTLSFNISHTRNLIVLAVSEQRALGVDVENVRDREVSLDIARRFFSPVEAAELALVPDCEQQYRFFEYWTFKESYIKARSMGLSIPLDKFSFHYPHDRSVRISIDPELGDDAARWQFWQFKPAFQYLVAVCAEQRHRESTGLYVKKTVPLDTEEALPVELLRVSDETGC